MSPKTFDVTHATRGPVAEHGLSSATEFVFSSAPGREDGVFSIEPSVELALRPVIAFGLSVGVAAALRREIPAPSQIVFRLSDSPPETLLPITDAFRTMTGVQCVLNWANFQPLLTSSGTVFLASGGKDTLFAIAREADQRSIAGLPAVYFGGGTELGWRHELEKASRVCRYYGLQLRVFRLEHGHTSSKILLKFPGRAAWREIITVTLARQFGDRIVTGINDDAVFRGMQPVHDPVAFLSQLSISVSALERTLRAEILTVPGEFAVYEAVRKHPLFDPAGSCLLPSVGCASSPCNKCRGFEIYEALLARIPLTREQIQFVTSARFLGDPWVVKEVESLARQSA